MLPPCVPAAMTLPCDGREASAMGSDPLSRRTSFHLAGTCMRSQFSKAASSSGRQNGWFENWVHSHRNSPERSGNTYINCATQLPAG